MLAWATRPRWSTCPSGSLSVPGQPRRADPAAAGPAQALMLRRVESGPGAAVARCVYDVLAAAEGRGVITPAQRSQLHAEVAAKLPAL